MRKPRLIAIPYGNPLFLIDSLKKSQPMIINKSPEQEVKKKKEINCSVGIDNMSTAINLISPAPITPSVNNKNPKKRKSSAGKKNIWLWWINENGIITANNNNTVLLLITLFVKSVHESLINNKTNRILNKISTIKSQWLPWVNR